MAALSLFFIVRAGEGIIVAVGGGAAVDAKLRRHLHALVLFGERHAHPVRVGRFVDRAVDGLFAGEEREQALLQSVFFIMPNELNFHVNKSFIAVPGADTGSWPFRAPGS